MSVDNSNDIANIFNNFFANVGKTTEKGIPQGSHSPLFYLRGNYLGSIFLSPVTSHEIWTFIGKMDASKSCGPYSVPATILKTVRDYTYPSLLHFKLTIPLLVVIFLRN